ncbi:unnamed protein product, partial [Rangifer tarandus platyrhynchus]
GEEEEEAEVEEEEEMLYPFPPLPRFPPPLLSCSWAPWRSWSWLMLRLLVPAMSPQDTLHLLVVELVHFLLLKYRTKGLTTKDEILNMVLREDGYHFLEAFHQASECLQLVFGMDVREVDHTKHTYMLVPTLGLSCDGTVSDGHTMPKTDLLVVVLGVILLEGNCTPEEGIWETLDDMGIYARREHYIYGEPRDKWHVLGYLHKINQGASRSFPLPSAEAGREEERGP